MGESDRTAIAKAAATGALKEKDKRRKPAASDSGAHRAVKLPDLLDDDLIAASSDPRLAVVGDESHPAFAGHPQFKHAESESASIPAWIWISLGGLLFVVLIGLVLVLLPGSSPEGVANVATGPERSRNNSAVR